MRWLVAMCVLTGLLHGCSATCLRDSDCVGASVCLRDRCVFVLAPSSEAGAPARGSAGASQVGGATPAREILDAASDGTPANAAP
jgi:hypothetical protein